MDVVDARDDSQEVLQVSLLREPRQLRYVVEAYIHKPLHASPLTNKPFDAGTIFFLGDYDGLSVGGNRVFPCYPVVTPAGDSDVYTNVIVDPTGDLNCDDRVDASDIEPFLMALFDPERYRAEFPNCQLLNGDTDDNGRVDAADIEGFLQLLFS